MRTCARGSSRRARHGEPAAGARAAAARRCRPRPSRPISSRASWRNDRVLIALNKPFGVVCKFSPEPGRPTLADFVPIRDVYPAGRLDTGSEGLLLLTDDGALQARIAHPRHKLTKTYWAQVEGVPTEAALA